MSEAQHTYKYKMIEGLYSVENETHTGYGIALDDDACPNMKFPDMSTNRAEVETLVDLCNSLQLSPIHLEDVVDDFLALI